MTKAEYNTWITDTYFIVNSCENLGTIDVVFNRETTLVMLIDLIKMTTVKQKIKDNNTREAIAIAFTKLMGGEIPKTENIPEYKRVPYNNNYYVIRIDSGKMFIHNYIEEDDNYDKNYFEMNNYFHTEARAKEVLDKINILLRLERLHDTLCPDYNPQNCDWRYSVYYNSDKEEWEVMGERTERTGLDKRSAYFPTLKIAQQAADILNKESI